MVNQKKIHYDFILRSLCELCEKKGKYQGIVETAQYFDDKEDVRFFSSQIEILNEQVEQLRLRILKKVVE